MQFLYEKDTDRRFAPLTRTRAFVNMLNVSRKRGTDLRSVSAHIGE